MTHKENQFKQTILSPDKVDLNIEYTITISPNDDYQFWKDVSSERLRKAENHMKYIVRQHINIDLDLYLDVSRNGRIHWHGKIVFRHRNSIKSFYLEIIHELLTKHQIEIDTIKDHEIWDAYCRKVVHLWDIKIRTIDLRKDKDRFIKLAPHQREIGEY